MVKGEHTERLSLLQGINLFRNWPYGQLSGLVRHFTVRNPSHGEYVYKENRYDFNLYLIVKGEFEVTSMIISKSRDQDNFKSYMKKNGRKKEIVILRLKEGGHFGAEDGYYNNLKIFSVRAVTNQCKLYLVPKDVNFE